MPRPHLSRWGLALALTVGVTAGIGGYTFSYAKGLSYFSTNPTACANCHIMRTQLAGWQGSSHHTVAVCVDCHLPHDFVPKYLAKAENGWRHSKEFTAQTFAEPIRLKPESRRILQANCERCHAEMISELAAHSSGAPDCLHCHATAGHGERAALGGPYKAAELESLSASSKDEHD
ncbi:MAG: cytochrome c nitrite reductase small subunit [Polyangiaceae bacterium]